MRVDFYQLSRDPAEGVVPLLARNAFRIGERVLVVSADAQQLKRTSASLWGSVPESFLAHGYAGGEHDFEQPLLLSDAIIPTNGAQFLILADGKWRESENVFTRIFLLFDEHTLQDARACWRMLGAREGVERRFWKQMGAKWVEGP